MGSCIQAEKSQAQKVRNSMTMSTEQSQTATLDLFCPPIVFKTWDEAAVQTKKQSSILFPPLATLIRQVRISAPASSDEQQLAQVTAQRTFLSLCLSLSHENSFLAKRKTSQTGQPSPNHT